LIANFSTTIERYDKKFYTLITHLIVHKCGKFHYIIYIIDMTKLCCIYGNLAVETLSKIFSTCICAVLNS